MPRPLHEYLDSESNPTEIEVEEEEGESSEVAVTTSTSSTSYSVIKWCGGRKKTPVVSFSAHVLLLGLQPEQRQIAEKYHLAYKFVKTECKLVRSILNSHCFREVHPNSPNFNLMWTGSHLKPHTLRGMQDFQKVNHFPRSYELTRKDRLYKNVQRLQHLKGYKHFDFIPNSFVLPEEYNEFYSAFMKDKGPWIVKPVASSRGRGIYLTNHPSQVPLDENLLICKYISNPLLIDGFKFDVRLYVGVTSYEPLRIYLYEEGLTRFATVKYDKSVRNIGNTCMHLTNYSVNKKSENFVSCQDPEVEDYGNKWSMSAMLRYLKEKGRDTAALMMRIEDVIIKTIIAGELPIASACKMFMPHPGNCFEIYGFDILIDERLRPWLLEVNLSPSLACESPLDLKIKSHLITDMFNLVGYVAHDPLIRRNPIRRVPDYSPSNKTYQKQRTMSAGPVLSSTSLRPSSSRKKIDEALTLTSEEMRILRQTNEEYDRRGGFVRIFPSSESWELYGSFLEHRTTHNQMIHTKLFPGRKASIHRPTTASLSSATARAKNLTTYGTSLTHNGTTVEPSEPSIAGQEELSITSRISCYERKLDSWSPAILQSRSTENVQSNSTGSLDQPASSHSLAKLQDNRLEIQGQTEVSTDQPRPQEGPSRSQSQVTLETQGSVPVMYAPRLRVQSAKEARPPRPQGSHETVSKRVLSAQPTFKAIRVEDIMDKSGALTKLQARQAFAMYLQRVQQRLIYEANYDSDDSTDSTRQDEQMSLVIRFLKKAAGNLQQPFKVVIPSRKLPLHDRRRILAKQLGDFVHIYGKETNQIQKRQEISRIYGLNRNTNNDSEIPDEDFKIFMAIASETELEDLLTRYTKLNKSASVFLGGSPDKVKEDNIGTANHVETGLNRRKEPETTLRGHLRSKSSSAQEESGWARPREEYDAPNNPSVIERHNRAVTTVSAYGASAALNKTKRRPASAKISSTQGTEKTSRTSRPFSAKVSRDRNTAATTDDSEDSTAQRKGYQKANEQAVALALQKLAKRQSARQYSPLTSTATTTTNWRDILSQLDQNADQDLTKPRDGDYANRTTKQDANDSRGYRVKDSLKSRDRHASANATFNSFVDYDRDDSDERFVHNTEVETAMHQHARTHPSQWRMIRVELPKEHDEQSLKEDRLEEKERKPPLELKTSVSREDYNRHIQLLSQKLSETKLSFNQAQHPCLPRPPPGPSPARKIINAKRMARLASSHYDQGAVTKQQDTACKLTNGYT